MQYLCKNYLSAINLIRTCLKCQLKPNARIPVRIPCNIVRLRLIVNPVPQCQIYRRFRIAPGLMLMFNLYTLLDFSDDKTLELNPKAELIMLIKRGILCSQRHEFDKAEKLLHMALDMAHAQNNQLGVTYVYDVMANMAFEREEYVKATTLFVNVMQRLLTEGAQENDIRLIHISTKLAEINFRQKRYDTAELGYKWCLEQLEKLEKQQNVTPNTSDLTQLRGIAHDKYAQVLLATNRVRDAIAHVEKACEIVKLSIDTCPNGLNNVLTTYAMLLNDLGAAYWRVGEYHVAEQQLQLAMRTSQRVPEAPYLNVIKANLGMVYISLNMIEKGRKLCQDAWRGAKSAQDQDALEQAQYCLSHVP